MFRFTARCERVRFNNGIVEVLFTRHSEICDSTSHDEHILVNVLKKNAYFHKGSMYLIDIHPEFSDD